MLSGEHVLTASHDGTVKMWANENLELCQPNYSSEISELLLIDILFIGVNFFIMKYLRNLSSSNSFVHLVTHASVSNYAENSELLLLCKFRVVQNLELLSCGYLLKIQGFFYLANSSICSLMRVYIKLGISHIYLYYINILWSHLSLKIGAVLQQY
jgi:hypothetical protein